jgi:hypothetical protein
MHTLFSFIFSTGIAIGALFGLHSDSTNTASTPASEKVITTASTSSKSTHVPGSSHSGVTSTISSSASSEALPTGSAWLTTLPLGDNRYVTSAPKKGYVYLCHVQSGGQGAQGNGPWIHGQTWTPTEKVRVQGSVQWPQASYTTKITTGVRIISSNDLPTDHTTGIFPIGSTDPAAAYDRNPSSIAAHSYAFSFSALPTAAQNPGCIYGEVGIMNDGVLLFDGFDALYRDALAHELQDAHDGHPNDGGYHKHGFISDIKNLSVSKVVGFAFDGYPITGPLLPSGAYLTTNDLDVCHGITSSITLDGKTQSSYHYVLTQDFPYSVSCFHGTSKVTPNTLRSQGAQTTNQDSAQIQTSSSVSTQPLQGQGTPPAPPQEAIDACVGKASGAQCQVGQSAYGACVTIGSAFACRPSDRR